MWVEPCLSRISVAFGLVNKVRILFQKIKNAFLAFGPRINLSVQKNKTG